MFHKDFVWGVAGSAYQIEGKEEQDGGGVSIWDTFVREGHILDGYGAEVACDHMHRYPADYKLMKHLGIKAYRFSISWARIMPEGTGRVNEKAITLYRNMILEMKKNGIEPYITMYHWELPQALEDKGGWLNEDIVEWFGEYARVVAENFADLSDYFITLNEPQCFIGLGYLSGVHAPGKKLPHKELFQMVHNTLRAHGMAVKQLRKYAGRPIKIGYAPTCSMAYPISDRAEDVEAARKALFGFYQPMDNWTWNVSWFSDPVFLGKYPAEGLKQFAEYLPAITEEDMKLISQPIDFMGQNIYNGYMIKADKNSEPQYVNRPQGAPKTAAGWPVTPECFYWGTRFLYERYQMPIYITENGMSCHDNVSFDGRVHDPNRIQFLDEYLGQLQRAVDDGVDIRGYFLWTFLDNFEWNKGYTEQFGIVYVDFASQKRIVKDSAYWYQKIIETNGRELSINKVNRNILFLQPVFKEMIWGGNRLGTEFHYDIPGERTGECWAVSAHENGTCMIKEGPYAGMTLAKLWQSVPELFGNPGSPKFPLLTKIIDAREDLSIQVHPDDAYAQVHENGSFGKTECWYILDCEEDAAIVMGHHAADKEELTRMIANQEWKALLCEVPVKKGDFVQIDPGTVHAIKGGTMILETQQNSDITYRVYDYDRLTDGKPRPLHLQQSMEVIKTPSEAGQAVVSARELPVNQLNQLITCDYYKVWKLHVTAAFTMEQIYPFLIVSVIEGDGLVDGQMVKKGDHFIVPAEYGTLHIQGDLEMILSAVG